MNARRILIEQSGRTEEELWSITSTLLDRHGDQVTEHLKGLVEHAFAKGDLEDAAAWLAITGCLLDLSCVREAKLH